MSTVRIGVIGLGMGLNHAKSLAGGKVPNAELTAVCSMDPGHRKLTAEILGDKVAFFEKAEPLMESRLCRRNYCRNSSLSSPTPGCQSFCTRPSCIDREAGGGPIRSR